MTVIGGTSSGSLVGASARESFELFTVDRDGVSVPVVSSLVTATIVSPDLQLQSS